MAQLAKQETTNQEAFFPARQIAALGSAGGTMPGHRDYVQLRRRQDLARQTTATMRAQ